MHPSPIDLILRVYDPARVATRAGSDTSYEISDPDPSTRYLIPHPDPSTRYLIPQILVRGI